MCGERVSSECTCTYLMCYYYVAVRRCKWYTLYNVTYSDCGVGRAIDDGLVSLVEYDWQLSAVTVMWSVYVSVRLRGPLWEPI